MAGGRVSPSESSESEGGDARPRLWTVPNLLSGLRLVLAPLLLYLAWTGAAGLRPQPHEFEHYFDC